MSFEPDFNPTPTGVMARLEYAARRASDGEEHTAARWQGWFQWQTGLALPLDLFAKYVSALDYLEQTLPYGTADDRLWAREAAQSYRTPLYAIVYSHFGLPKKVAA